MMNLLELEKEIEIIWENRNNINSKTSGNERDIIEKCLALLDNGEVRVSQR